MSLNPEAGLLLLLTSVQSRLTKKAECQLSAHGISFTEFLVLHYLAEASSQTMRRIDLAERIGLSASGVTRLLQPMEKIGLVEKEVNPRDARVSLVKLSTAGSRIYSEAENSFNMSVKSLMAQVNPKQRQQLQALIDLLL